MKAFFAYLLAISTALILASCNEGSSAPPPTDVTLVPGDGVITVSWSMAPSVDYWLFYAPASSISTGNWTTLPGSGAKMYISSPYILTGLTNGTTYSVTINGRINGGPGGAGTPSVSAVPRLAGATWNTGTATGISDLRGVTYGTVFVAVGANGATLSSSDGKAWTTQNSGVSTPLYAAVYGGSYLAAGAGGAVLLSTDAVTWASQTSGTVNDLYGLAANGGFYLAVGANGTIITSSGGASWTTPASGTSNTLYGVAYGNGRYVAVGANGTVLTSADASTWQTVTPLTGSDLKSVAYGTNASTGIGTFVALGSAGTLLTSTDGLTWTMQTSIASNPAINAVMYSTQFVAVGNSGAIFTSTDGINWTAPTSVTPSNTNNLYAIAHGNYDYTSVGSAGTNLTAY